MEISNKFLGMEGVLCKFLYFLRCNKKTSNMTIVKLVIQKIIMNKLDALCTLCGLWCTT